MARKKNFDIIKTILAITVSIIHFLPLYIAITVAFKPKTDLSSRWIMPKSIYLENFIYAIKKAKIFIAMKNSFIITLISVVIIVAVGAMAAYPFARNKTKFNKITLNLVLAVMMVPPLSVLVPLVTMMSKMGGISTYWGIILTVTTFQLPLSIFLYTNFIDTIPKSLDEAALIDGCSRFAIYYRIILPLLKPVTATVIILTGIFIWNDYQFSLYMLQSPKMKVVTLAVSTFFAQSSSNLNAAAAAALMGVLPVAILYLFLQKYFVKGMVDGAVK
ncbi:MAG: raffinose/stachyose/melibiose transport system permease protein [Fusobacteriaceae bacterium]|jgi:raffinose/stachyose/melibiose transport system permease protein|nr:binding-protein-dependent transport system inner rane component [Fusobacteriales bacterium]MDN5305199.1 raffinose/stachyose/melibiose transport system permease protein [Fusobacteriaceae bacterium]